MHRIMDTAFIIFEQHCQLYPTIFFQDLTAASAQSSPLTLSSLLSPAAVGLPSNLSTPAESTASLAEKAILTIQEKVFTI